MDVIRVNLTNTVVNFWNAVKIYYNHPNSLNKQILFSEEVLSAKLKSLSVTDCHKLFDELSSKLSVKYDMHDCLNGGEYSSFNMEIRRFSDGLLDTDDMVLLVRKLIPKLYSDENIHFYEFIFCDKLNSKVYIFTRSITKNLNMDFPSTELKKQDPFVILKFNVIQLVYNPEFLELYYDKTLGVKGINWLRSVFINKFSKLASNVSSSNTSNNKVNKLVYESKIDVVQYYKFYERMKSKYAKYLIDNWSENTDPKKFVYEDIGIATYVMMLWNGGQTPDAGAKKQKFVDLGCGNGLLVHILNSEGHLGVGLDIRKRKIWDAYPLTTILKEETIIPMTNGTYPQADWLIGNHSDELTAWIPIMARRSCGHCQYFVLPCCPYELNGMKYQRKNTGLSSYQDFISYVKNISSLCDFETYVDKLRIPSTKRICLIGLNKPDMSEEKYCLVNEKINDFITQECRSNIYKGSKVLDFKVRESVERVRNCTKLSQGLKDKILKIVVNELLKETVICTVINGEDVNKWNRGGKVTIGYLASCIDEDILRELKKECKGLQTLLKNHHFLFEVGQGFVQLRSPESMLRICDKLLESKDQHKWKRKKCWFFNNHPDKCPLSDERCSYSHD